MLLIWVKRIAHNYIGNAASNADICVHYDTSAIVTDTRVFIILNP
ncbi:DUF3172 domain-containing protein [Nostoc sp.]